MAQEGSHPAPNESGAPAKRMWVGLLLLSILTVSDHIACGGACTALEREQSFNQMIELALALV